MKEFDYNIDYKNTLFKPNDTRYRIGRGEQGVLLVRPYTDDICKHWKFKNPVIAERSAKKITSMYFDYAADNDFAKPLWSMPPLVLAPRTANVKDEWFDSGGKR